MKDGFAEIALSIAGSIGVVGLISALLAANDDKLKAGTAFAGYFEGGQVGLTILAVSGAAFGALLRHPQKDKLGSFIMGIILLAPIIATSLIIGLNPGFVTGGLTDTVLLILWCLYALIHLIWFIFIVRSPTVPNAQEAGRVEINRVSTMKERASNRAQ
ncbi:hypothetical protein HKX23_17220 [Sulfitobacter sp. KE29]|uniref:hypothetical protein n=1 Tax=unclassified Sulfitobacter TaxID=196795 RepID=UPI0010AD23E0|nr:MULTISPECIES: hypothetical protein [unclassified Sulfitobacter]MBO9440242.1 hypothetical protein [Sulfitobacter sp. R18_2]MDF3420057.1 hypothetical protein [Sulfitobacter sp. Ks38]MDF3427582.1 hypothetical protein [Sulfitobacter sp. KE29]MDF3431162.1 hypothetical protein [Sulfitobacter sp. S46]MDF3445894.1 hypothetical protein [Sulfitobacter sp. KE31]